MSGLEEHILKILKKEKIFFEREKTFSDLRGGKYRYDFYLPNVLGGPILIEVDGQQHFELVKHFHKNRQGFLKTKEHDRRKNSYALANGIPLYRIPYWEIENIKCFKDIIQSKFHVRTKWFNDNLKIPK